jgi:hypothetical protein
MDQPAAAQPSVLEERRAPVVAEAQPAAAAVVEMQPAVATATEARSVAPAAEEAERAAAAEEGGRAPVVAEARPEAVVAASRQAPVATEAQVEAPAEVAQGPAPASGSRAVVVEVPDDDSLPPGWDQWVSFPTLSPGRRLPAARLGHGAEASSSRAGHSA